MAAVHTICEQCGNFIVGTENPIPCPKCRTSTKVDPENVQTIWKCKECGANPMTPLISLPIFGNKYKFFWKCEDCNNDRLDRMNAWNMDMAAFKRIRE